MANRRRLVIRPTDACSVSWPWPAAALHIRVREARRQQFRRILTITIHIPLEIEVHYQGSCHCGQITYSVEGDLEQVMECNCSHCSRKGYLLWFVPRASLSLTSPDSALAAYTFNKHVISHHFCRKCGCAPFGFGKDRAGAATAAINVRCLEGIELSSLKKLAVDGRSF